MSEQKETKEKKISNVFEEGTSFTFSNKTNAILHETEGCYIVHPLGGLKGMWEIKDVTFGKSEFVIKSLQFMYSSEKDGIKRSTNFTILDMNKYSKGIVIQADFYAIAFTRLTEKEREERISLDWSITLQKVKDQMILDSIVLNLDDMEKEKKNEKK